MKICIKVTLISMMTLATNWTKADDFTMAVISDVHIMAPTLLKQDGKAFDNYVAHDRKMLRESIKLMEQATNKILSERPQIVLITGDLTKDGEQVSHEYLCREYLSRMKKAGIKVYVIPGNHDVDNPHAVEFLGDTTRRVPSPNKEAFAKLYNDYGYGEALARDTHSLSYVVQLDTSTRLLCLDACKYEQNDYEKDICVTAGRLKPETICFIKAQMAEAKKRGQRMLAAMHHGIVEHWKWQGRAMKEYLIDDWRKQGRLFSKLGIEVVFTGHFHAQDIAERKGVYDVETGSLVSYPSPYRIVRLNGNTLTITTHLLAASGLNLEGDETLQQYGEQFALSGISNIINDMLPSEIPVNVKSEVSNVIAKAYVAHLAGDEQFTANDKALINAASNKLKEHSWKYNFIFRHVAKNLWTDIQPQDNNIIITLKK